MMTPAPLYPAPSTPATAERGSFGAKRGRKNDLMQYGLPFLPHSHHSASNVLPLCIQHGNCKQYVNPLLSPSLVGKQNVNPFCIRAEVCMQHANPFRAQALASIASGNPLAIHAQHSAQNAITNAIHTKKSINTVIH